MTDLALELDHDSRLRAVGPVPLTLLGLIVVALIVAVAIWGRAWFPALPSEDMNVALANPPEVEPVVLEQVSEETARELNAATPFTTLAVPAARPFKFSGGSTDYARAVDCLASAIYYEAGAEPREGMEAVAQVVLNRVRHPAFPKSICGVIFQGQERRTGCQFSYTCDGSMARRPSASAWETMRSIARNMIGGKVYAPVGWATHYHTDWVRPVWSSKLDKVAAVRTHLFFRWPGFWGSPKVFGKGGANEQAMARLVGLSAVHRTPETLAQAAELEKLMAALAASGAASGDTVFSDPAGGQFILTIAPGSDPGLLPGLADKTCAGREYCKVFAWSDPGAAPKGFPIDDKAFGTMAFSFYRNKAQEFEKPLWNCATFPREDKRQCIRKRVVIEGKPQELIPMTAEAPAEPPRAVAGRSDGLRPVDPETGETLPPAPPVSRTEGRRRPGAGT